MKEREEGLERSKGLGKNFSRNRKRKDRSESDFYQTPYCLTEEFLRNHSIGRWSFESTIADFCSGDGAIQVVLRRNGFLNLIERDLRRGDDFFDLDPEESYEYGLMNPPFRLFNDWVCQCYRIFSTEFCLLGPTTYLQGVGRYNSEGTGIFQHETWRLAYVYTFNRYPMLSIDLRQDGLIKTGMQTLSWFVFNRTDSICQLRWLDIDRYVHRKGTRRVNL